MLTRLPAPRAQLPTPAGAVSFYARVPPTVAACRRREATRIKNRRHLGPPHIGGTTPSRPTPTVGVVNDPSACLVAPKMMIWAPGLSSLLSPGGLATIVVLGGTTTFFSPSLYLTRMFWPSTPATVVSTIALVMVLPGCRSQGLCLSDTTPFCESRKMWTATAF